MSEHLLFLQAAGTGFSQAHDLVAAVTETIRAPHGDPASPAELKIQQHRASFKNGYLPRRPAADPEALVERLNRAGCDSKESLLVALAVHATIASPTEVDADWIASVAARVDDAELLLETSGVVFAFNTINRIADARQVKLEYRFLRELKPIQGWVERRFASLAGLAYDLSFKYQPQNSASHLQNRLRKMFEGMGVSKVPHVFNWLSRSPVVLEGVLEMFEASIQSSQVRCEFLKEAASIAVASRGISGSCLNQAVDRWVSQDSLSDANSNRESAAPSDDDPNSELGSAFRRYSWKVANAAYSIHDDHIREIAAFGIVEAELLDITLATAIFSAVAIIEPISAAVAPPPAFVVDNLPVTRNTFVEAQLT